MHLQVVLVTEGERAPWKFATWISSSSHPAACRFEHHIAAIEEIAPLTDPVFSQPVEDGRLQTNGGSGHPVFADLDAHSPGIPNLLI